MQSSILCCFILLIALAHSATPPTWSNPIKQGATGSPVSREFQTLTNFPTTSVNLLFSGIIYNGSTFDAADTWVLHIYFRKIKKKKLRKKKLRKYLYSHIRNITKTFVYTLLN